MRDEIKPQERLLGELEKFKLRVKELEAAETERKKSEAALRKSESRLRDIIHDQTELICRFHPDRTISFANDAYCEYFGKKSGDVIGSRFAQNIPEEDGARLEAHLNALSPKSNVTTLEHRVLTPNGDARWQKWSYRAKFKNGEFLGVQAVGHDISKRKDSEIALQESEERYRGLFEDAPISLWEEDFSEIKTYLTELKNSGVNDFRAYFESRPQEVRECAEKIRILDVNKATLKMLKAESKEQLLGNLKGIFREESYEMLREELISLAEGHDVFEREALNQTLLGNTINTKIKLSIAPNYEKTWSKVFVSFEDITDQKVAEKALRESEERYRGLIESSPEAVFVHQDGKLVFMNLVGLRMLGYDSVEVINHLGFNSLFERKDDNDVAKFIAEGSENEVSPLLECRLIRKDHSIVDVEIKLIFCSYEGRSAVQGVARDITETKNLRRLAARMERLAALGEIAATISHEIRNPLGSIGLYFNSLKSRLIHDEKYTKAFKNIEHGISRIQNIIKGVLDFARPNPPALKQRTVHKVLDSSLRSVQHDLEAANVKLIKSYAEDLPDVLIDANQIVQVFVNLFLNAKDAMNGGGALTVTTTRTFDAVKITIEDTGKGIEPENLEKIFNPFFTTKTEGTGLGMAVVSRILEQHEAQIYVENKAGGGAKFAILFPIV